MTPRPALSVPCDWRRSAVAATLGSCLTYIFLLAGTLHALDPSKHLTQYMHTSWRTQDGSAPTGMSRIVQTSDGFLWFVSMPFEVYRFDGVRILKWHLPAGTSVGPVSNLFADHAGGLWVMGQHGIVRVKDGVVTSHFELPGAMFQTVSEDPDGSVWIVPDSNDAPLCRITGTALKCFGKADGIPISSIDALLADGKSGFWLGGQTALVHWHSGVSETHPIEGLKAMGVGIDSLARGPDGTLWVGILGPGGLRQLKDGAIKEFVNPNFDGSKVAVISMMFDRDGNLWVGTESNGLFRIHGEAVEHYGRAEGLSGDSVWALFEDREGMVWAGTSNGIDNFRDSAVTTFSQLEGIAPPMGVLASRDGSVWVATGGSLDRIVNGNVSSIRTGKGLPGEQVTRMLEDHAGNLWIGVDYELYLFKDGQFRRIADPNGKPLGLVFQLVEDTDGNIWAGCRSAQRRLVRIRSFQVRDEFSPSQVPTAWMMAANPQGGIWIATKKGELIQFRGGLQQKFSLNEKAKEPSPHEIVGQPDGSVLAAFEDGLAEWRGGKVQWMTTKNGLPCNPVIHFIQDKEKHWWLYTRCGVVEFADSELQRWRANPQVALQTHFYDALDGAQPNIAAFNGAALAPDGRVWFASGLVVQMVDPSRLSQKAPPAAQTYIESLNADRKEYPASEKLKLPPNPRDLQIDYTSPTFLIPQRVKFRYRLDGYDRDWHDAGTRRQAFYTDLPPGKYSFRVIASNSDGVWNDSAAKLDFSVVPAFYQTNWFRALCVVGLLALLWAAYWWRVRQLQHRFELTLDARVGERTRIARELHDTLLQGFQALMLRFGMVDRLLPSRAEDAKKELREAMAQARETITEGRDAVQALRLSTIETNDLVRSISEIGQELAACETGQASPSFEVRVEGVSRELRPLLRDEVYRIAAEALRNAFCHAQARQVEAEIRYDKEQFRLRVRDNGKGIDPAVLSSGGRPGHYGLPGMRERANVVGGKLTVWSELDTGTEVEVTIPGTRAYAAAPRNSWWSRRFYNASEMEETKIES